MATKSEIGSSAGKSQMSDSRKDRLLDIQKREQLKGMLVNKFKLKYGDKPNIVSYIDNEVQRFLKNDRLNEDNLKKLDDRILKECELRDKKEALLDDRRSTRSSGSQQRRPASQAALDTRSIASSRMSGASALSKT